MKAINRSASSLVQSLSLYKSEATFAPTGYPEVIHIERANAPTPGTLKIGLISGFKSLPIMFRKLVFLRSSIHIKNGSNDGITLFTQSKKASCATL